ncbi:MAG: MATE family efflux transporter [Verrucomicrobia bacterium]|nr:MAG: MATE family efflux transporter [Verrucomicrobiota bacterium]
MSATNFQPLEKPGGYRETLRMAVPLVISTGSFTLMQFVDRIFLTRYSVAAIQAALPAGLLAFTLICMFSGITAYAGTFVAQFHGAGDPRGTARATAQAVILSLLAWPLMLALTPVGEIILRHCGHAPDVLHEELIFYRILMLGSVAVPLGAAISGFFTGRGDTRTNMVAVVIGNLANILMDWLFIFGHWGCPRMGIAGAGWATVLSGLMTPLMLLALYFGPRLRRAYDTLATFRLDWTLMLRLLRFGLPAAMHLLLDVGSFTLFLLLTARLGAKELAASNIAFSINNLAFMPLIGIGTAASILVGQYQGRGQSDVAERAGWNALKIGWYYMGAIGLTFLLFPHGYFLLFTGHAGGAVQLEDVLPVGRWMLVMMAVWGLADAANIILSSALRGAGDTRFVMLFSFMAGWILWLGGEALLLLVFHGGMLAAWAWLVVYVFIMVAGFAWRYHAGHWKTIDLLGHQPSA